MSGAPAGMTVTCEPAACATTNGEIGARPHPLLLRLFSPTQKSLFPIPIPANSVDPTSVTAYHYAFMDRGDFQSLLLELKATAAGEGARATRPGPHDWGHYLWT
jgi:hypothetical protein